MERVLDQLIRLVGRIAHVSGWICGLLLTLSAALIGLDIFLRETFVITIGGANEIAGYALAISSSWGCTVALVLRMHVRIDSMYARFSTRIRAALDIVGLFAFVYFMMFVTYYAGLVLEQSVTFRSRSISALEAPLAIPQAIWFAGFVVFMFASSILLLRAVIAFARGDLRRIQDLLGARSVEEEMAFEKESLGLAGRPKGSSS